MALQLSPGEWAVLGVIAEGPTHGFAVAQLLSAEGQVGRVWTVPRPVVYQNIKKLTDSGLVAPRKVEHGGRGPLRSIVGVTPRGRSALKRWLVEPVEHVRDVRSLLLLKLALIYRSHHDPAALLDAQRDRILPQLQGLEAARDLAAGFDRVLIEWRIAGSRAALEFLAAVRRSHCPPD